MARMHTCHVLKKLLTLKSIVVGISFIHYKDVKSIVKNRNPISFRVKRGLVTKKVANVDLILILNIFYK